MKRKVLTAAPGMVFGVPQKDSLLLVGQVLDLPTQGTMSIVLFNERVQTSSATQVPLSRSLTVLSTVTTFCDGLERGYWPLIREGDELALPQSQWPNEATRATQWVGRRIYNAKLIDDFVNACAGLVPWRLYAATPDCFDKMLFPGVQRPKEADLIGGPT
jgi:hypothetical protein